MKEILAIVRINKVSETKTALAEAGFPSFTCRKVFGRGKRPVSFDLIQDVLENSEEIHPSYGEHISEVHRLISKRVFVLVTPDDQVEKLVQTIMKVNSTGHPGDGKIFIMSVLENYQVRSGEIAVDAF